ncbi:MAG: SHOCT domain-containing protein [Dehalococcoidia bacterium]
MMGNNFPGWWMGIGLLWSLIFWGAIVFLIVWGVRTLTSRREERPSQDPLTILKERYARGEITREQYEQMRQDLLK